ncbi:helix-turn-helix domain-containing protein [Amycolatopsis vancoresmycina]|uniref:Putative phage repressor protein CI n=1 Tax=Amycolatopsis vancoresmycina DSM 44592 TaxID=1292037 RepID=R1I2W7_9PSEU|nr:helix-turn-helix transcriptional regulator [Amycolatopsis vancoresmycina]EOD66871.1 putative phage repressor protein CI [Amycolatopsis vancoresmycina DSM 44592]
MTDFATAFGKRLKLARSTAGLTQTQLGELIGLTRSSVANLEAGRQAASAELAVRAANAVGAGVQWLLTGDAKIALPRDPIDRRALRVIAASLRHAVHDLDVTLGADP